MSVFLEHVDILEALVKTLLTSGFFGENILTFCPCKIILLLLLLSAKKKKRKLDLK